MLDTKAIAEATAIIVREHVERATAPLLERLGKLEAREIPVIPDVQTEIAKAVGELPLASDGKDVAPEVLAQMVGEAVSEAVRRLPAPRDGKSITIEDVSPLIDEAVAKAVAEIPTPKDGVGLAGSLIDRTGSLIVTMTDGSTRDLGLVVGKDADQGALEKLIRDSVAAIPVPKDGQDGFGFDDMAFEHDGERGFVLRFVKGERTKEFAFTVPVVIDRGVYKDGQTYAPGDGVTWAGSYWIAQKETSAKPDSGEGFRLAVKRGRDAKAS